MSELEDVLSPPAAATGAWEGERFSWWAQVQPTSGGDAEDVCGAAERLGIFWTLWGATGNMPGHVVAATASMAVRYALPAVASTGDEQFFRRAFSKIQSAITALEGPVHRGAAVSIAAVAFTRRAALLAHVGTCRVYRLRGGRLEQLTQDHTFERARVRGTSWLSASEKEKLPDPLDPQHDFVVLRCIPRSDLGDTTIRAEFSEHDRRRGDLFFLTSPGVHLRVEPARLEEILTSSAKAPRAAVSNVMNSISFEPPEHHIPYSGGAAIAVQCKG